MTTENDDERQIRQVMADLEAGMRAGDDIAFCHSLNRLSDGAPEGFGLWFRATTGLRRREGRWRVVHEHTSTPFYLDGSFKAAIDLKP